MVVEVHSLDEAGSFGDFSNFGERMAAKCRQLLGRTATIRNDQSRAPVSITALYFRVEPTGFHQEIEIAWVEEDGTHRIGVDESLLSVEHGSEPADIIGEEVTNPADITPSIDDTVKMTSLEMLSNAVTEFVKLGSAISEMAKTALPVGTRVEHPCFGDGTVKAHTESDDGMVYVEFDDEKFRNATDGPFLVEVDELAINGRYLDQNYIPF